MTGYQHTTALDIDSVDLGLSKLGVPENLKNLTKGKPISIYAGAVGGQLHDSTPSFNTKFSDTNGYRFGASAGAKFHGTGPLLVTDSLSYAPNITSLSVNLGILGKTIFAVNNLFHKE